MSFEDCSSNRQARRQACKQNPIDFPNNCLPTHITSKEIMSDMTELKKQKDVCSPYSLTTRSFVYPLQSAAGSWPANTVLTFYKAERISKLLPPAHVLNHNVGVQALHHSSSREEEECSGLSLAAAVVQDTHTQPAPTSTQPASA